MPNLLGVHNPHSEKSLQMVCNNYWLFSVGGVITMETECLRLLFGVYRTQILPSLVSPRVVVVSNQSSFKTLCMHTF